MTPEAKVKRRVVTLLKELGCWYCFPVASGHGASGVPDILGCMFGGFFAIECKAGDNKPTAMQEFQINLIKQAHGTVWVVRESNFDQFEKEIRQMCALWTTPMNQLTGYGSQSPRS